MAIAFKRGTGRDAIHRSMIIGRTKWQQVYGIHFGLASIALGLVAMGLVSAPSPAGCSGRTALEAAAPEVRAWSHEHPPATRSNSGFWSRNGPGHDEPVRRAPYPPSW